MSQLKHFPLPDVGEGLTEAEVLNWRVQPGDTVTLNQTIVEIETAKASVELPCPYAGTISELLAEPGQTVEVGTPIVAIDLDSEGAAVAAAEEPAQQAASAGGSTEEGTAGEVANLVGYGPRSSSSKRRPRKATTPAAPSTASNGVPAQQSARGAQGAQGAGIPAAPAGAQSGTSSGDQTSMQLPVAEPAAVNGSAPQSNGTAASGGSVPLAKPPVRKLAKDLGVDLRSLAGSGAEGIITRTDVERAATGGAAGGESLGGAASAGSVDETARERRVPIKGVRKATAQAMVDSAFTAPHVTEFLTVDVTPMMEFRERLKSHPEFQGVKVTPLAVLAKALCLAVRRTPDVNATWDEQAGEIVYKDYVHLGIAAATPRGLVVPKVRDAEQLSLRELAESLETLTAAARDGRTAPADMVNGSITITNVGVFGVDTGTPILNPGESAILAFGAIRDMPWVVDGQVVPRKVCQLALSFDHRVVDGQQGSQFLADVGALLADPGMAMTY
ncbi:dihydrolipoamide acetyltransferase family protein [Haloactinomyces albus]|uniref:Dihydrolipoamide acetyltransferase component of pyruvate dehydrogenase complex n=1 Tax=Haloactinomyces albus TaxID=1352928 RepID=A0AAE4CLS4_9ACTN|nr:dihydrolipoamide acetyltransferase family protein [Haloactinomyces albus]MDR7302139.1 pyruvate dehydrogenase E2 component (dihydrolipoamide acetyltransferase) [Haloactinomyces albus]